MQYCRKLTSPAALAAVLLLSVFQIVFTGCEGTTFRSSVPAYPVRVVIDTKMGAFVHFQPEALGTYVVANRDGYFLNERWVASSSAMDAYGYGGVLVYISAFGYNAFDQACPNCAEKGTKSPCAVDGGFAVCTTCEERYDLLSGTAAPQKGIAREALRRLTIINSDGRLTITQGQ